MTSKPLQEDDASSKSEVAPGEVLGGKFRVERVVGRGGMGVVVEATNIQLDQKVALKLLATKRDDPASVERFNSEAKAAARLRSEHVARVFDVGKDTIHGPFIVMEMLEGKTLADVIASTGRVAPHRAVEYIIDACEGLAEAHARGIIHQDVKPANLFLVTGPDGRPSVKLLDFGIATMRSKEREVDPKSSHPSLGTPAYLAPEQLRNTGNVTHRADVWSLGCVLYELLVGDRPFRARRFTELVTKILETPPEPMPADLQLPAPLVAAIVRCLERDPEKRFASSAGLAIALMPFARARAHLAVTRAVGHATKSGIDPDLRVPESTPPEAAPQSSPELDFPRSDQLRAPGIPKFSTGPIARGDVPTLSPGEVASRASANESKEKKSPLVLIGLAVGVLLLGIAVFLVLGRQTADQAPASSAPAPPAEKAPATTTPTATAEATAATTDAPIPTVSARPVAPTIPVRPALAPKPKPSASAKPVVGGESEIRFQR